MRHPRGLSLALVLILAAAAMAGCGADDPQYQLRDVSAQPSESLAASSAEPSATESSASPSPSATTAVTLSAGNPDGGADIPAEAQAEDTSAPDRVVGDGTPDSCTSNAVTSAVAKGGVITFDCGSEPLTITLTETAKVRNDRSSPIVIDGGGRITLSGGGKRRILYMNTCDADQVWTTTHCNDQKSPQLTVQNITFADGNATGERTDGGGGGAIFVRGGRFKAVNTLFVRNRCDATGPDLGGAAIRVLDQYQDLPVYIVNSTFGGASGQGGSCSNGGALSGIGVSWVVLNSLFSHNSAIGNGANPARDGTPGGGSGGAIYADGNQFTIRLAGTVIENNTAAEGGGAIFFVSNNRTGTMRIEDSVLSQNTSSGFETKGYPGIFFLGASDPTLVRSTLTK